MNSLSKDTYDSHLESRSAFYKDYVTHRYDIIACRSGTTTKAGQRQYPT